MRDCVANKMGSTQLLPQPIYLVPGLVVQMSLMPKYVLRNLSIRSSFKANVFPLVKYRDILQFASYFPGRRNINL